MPSRPVPPNPIRPSLISRSNVVFLILSISFSLVAFFAVVFFVYRLWHSLHSLCSRAMPFDVGAPLKLQRFTYKELKLATNDFDDANVIGKGGSGTVFRGIAGNGKLFAVKRLDGHSLQAEIEFQNELQILGGLRSPFLVTLFGYCVEKSHGFLVYEYMPNKSLQELLFSEDETICLSWERRFSIILDVAKALEFMHFGCDPPVIHGDIKPSNVLLDSEFRAKLSDFGLSRVKIEGDHGVDLFSQDLGKSQEHSGTFGGDITPPTAIGTPTHEVDFALALQASSSSKNSGTSYSVRALNLNSMSYNANMAMETKGKEVSNDENELMGRKVEDDELEGTEQGKDLSLSPNSVLDVGRGSKQWGKDWWWKQDGNGELCSKDYVREWIGSQIYSTNHQDWVDDRKTSPQKLESRNSIITVDKPEDRDGCGVDESRFDTLEEKFAKEESINESTKKKKRKHMKMQEWWKDEHQDEMSDKRTKCFRIKLMNRLKIVNFDMGRRFCVHRRRRRLSNGDEEEEGEFSFRRGWRRKGSKRSMAGSEMWSGDIFSRELSSTTSMRGTLCYIAPEYSRGGCQYSMEKCDIYSFGVLMLVIVSGRRPIHVLGSPMKLEKANLVSWCRHLAAAGSGNILEIVDERLNDEYNREEAGLCINLALACLQRSPELRPDMAQLVRFLNGPIEFPSPAAFEFSPSPPAKYYGGRSRKW